MEGLLLLNTILKHHANSYQHIYTKNPKPKTLRDRSLSGREAERFESCIRCEIKAHVRYGSPCSPRSPLAEQLS